MGGEFGPGRRQCNVAIAWKRGVVGLHAGQCVCGLKMNKLISRTRWLIHILHLHQRNQTNQILFQYLRDKKKKESTGAQKKGGENSPISPPLDPRLGQV